MGQDTLSASLQMTEQWKESYTRWLHRPSVEAGEVGWQEFHEV